MSKLRTAVRAAFNRVYEAERARNFEIARLCSPGDRIRYEHGYNAIAVTVLSTGGERLKVRNENSGKEYWISALSVL